MKQRGRGARGLQIILLGAALAASVVTSASAAPKARGGPKTAQDIVMEQQELMIRECGLGDEQQKALKDKFKAKLEALAAWEKANTEKVAAAGEAARAARQGSDANAKKTAAGNLKELEASRAQATAEADKAILDVLSAEQKLTWAGAHLAQTTLPRYKKANLGDDQATKIRSACVIAARDLAEFTGDDKKSKQGRTTVQKCLKWAVDNVILTPDQRATMNPRK